MFNAVSGRRKGRVWSPRTVAISVGAHALLLAAFVTAAESTPAISKPEPRITWIDPRRPEPPKPAEPRPIPVAPQAPHPRTGRTVELPTPDRVLDTLPPADPNATPIHPGDVRGDGPIGDVIGPPRPDTTTATHGNGDGTESILDEHHVDVLPQLANAREAQRMLERVYPTQLRDAGITGRTTVRLIIDADGKVQPGSVTVVETTNDAFSDAAVRAAERFRFRPAQVNGHAVPVYISIPIDWQIAG
jgi:protein TonB